MVGSGYIPKTYLDHLQRELRRGCSRTTSQRKRASSSRAGRRTAAARDGRASPGVSGHQPHRRGAAHRDRAPTRRVKSQKPRAIEPGRYTVILEPRASARFLSLMMWAVQRAHGRGSGRQLFQRQAARHHEGRREAVRRHGDDQEATSATPSCGRRRSAPTAWPRTRVTWVDKGVLKNLFYDRRLGEAPEQGRTRRRTPNMSLVMEGYGHHRWSR